MNEHISTLHTLATVNPLLRPKVSRETEEALASMGLIQRCVGGLKVTDAGMSLVCKR